MTKSGHTATGWKPNQRVSTGTRTVHETLRAYAEERLAEAEEQPTFRARHLAWTMAFAESQQDALAPQFVTRKATLDRVELEHDNIRQALRWALSEDPGTALRLAAAVGEFWRMRGHLDEGQRWTEAVLAAAPDGDLRTRAVLLERAGSLLLHQGDVVRAVSYTHLTLPTIYSV